MSTIILDGYNIKVKEENKTRTIKNVWPCYGMIITGFNEDKIIKTIVEGGGISTIEFNGVSCYDIINFLSIIDTKINKNYNIIIENPIIHQVYKLSDIGEVANVEVANNYSFYIPEIENYHCNVHCDNNNCIFKSNNEQENIILLLKYIKKFGTNANRDNNDIKKCKFRNKLHLLLESNKIQCVFFIINFLLLNRQTKIFFDINYEKEKDGIVLYDLLNDENKKIVDDYGIGTEIFIMMHNNEVSICDLKILMLNKELNTLVDNKSLINVGSDPDEF